MTTEYIQPRIDIRGLGSIRLGTIERLEIKDGKEIKVKFRWVRGHKHKRARERTVFIAILPGKWSLYSRHKGTSMFENRSPGETFPGIQTSDDIHENRRWVLGILQDNSSTPVFQDFRNASYYQCPKERRPIKVAEFEAWQEIGATDLRDNEIHGFATQLWSNWHPENYEARLWNSQNFVVYLSILIMERGSRHENLQPLRDLHWTLWLKQNDKLEDLVIRRHVTAMAGFLVLGIATGGVGAVASWAYAGYGLVEPSFASDNQLNGLRRLINEFQALENLLTSEDEEED